MTVAFLYGFIFTSSEAQLEASYRADLFLLQIDRLSSKAFV